MHARKSFYARTVDGINRSGYGRRPTYGLLLWMFLSAHFCRRRPHRGPLFREGRRKDRAVVLQSPGLGTGWLSRIPRAAAI